MSAKITIYSDTRIIARNEVSVPRKNGCWQVKTYFAGKPQKDETIEQFTERIKAKYGEVQIFDFREMKVQQ